jgi:hypothetical protein
MMTALLAAPTRATDAVAARAREASSIDDGEDVDRTTTRDGDERASDERADVDDASASGSQPMGSLESESSPIGSLASDEEADEDDEDDGRRDAKKEWTLEEERMFYETYLSTNGNMKKVCDAMERAPYERDRKLVQKFRFNATRRLQGCLKSLNLSLDTKDKREVLEAFRSYWKFRQAAGLEGESVRAFGQRLGLKVHGLQKKCAEALRRDLSATGLRPEWRNMGEMEASGRGKGDAVAKTDVTHDVVDEFGENIEGTDSVIVENGKPKFVVQMFPLNRETYDQVAGTKGFNPILELALRQRKTVSSLALHLSEKWVHARPTPSHILQIYPFSSASGALGPWNVKFGDLKMTDLFASLDEPRCFRLRYAWVHETKARAPGQTPPKTVEKRKSNAFSGISIGAVTFDPIPGDTPATKTVKQPLDIGTGELTMGDFANIGDTNPPPTLGSRGRQPLARVNSQPAAPPLSDIFRSPKKSKLMPHSDASLLGVLDGIDDIEPGIPDFGGGDTLNAMGMGISDSLLGFEAGDSQFLRDFAATRSRAPGVRENGGEKGPTTFTGMFKR